MFTGYVFHSLENLPSTYQQLVGTAINVKKWTQMCDGKKSKKWVTYDANDNPVTATPFKRRRSRRIAAATRGNERALRREELRRELRGRHQVRWPRPDDVPHGEVHIYTDGSAMTKNGVRKAGCGAWFADNSPFNISTSLRGRQTNNRAEMTEAILALRKEQSWPTLYKSVTIFSDSKLCVDACPVNVCMSRWKIDGWTRGGRRLLNADLW